MEPPKVIAIFGPTGVGKTAVAVALAKRLEASGRRSVAVSCDAMQVYQGLEILTGVASKQEKAELEHRLLSFRPLDTTFSVGEYAKLAHAEIDSLLAEGAIPIVIGGTGLYLRAALTELDLLPPVDPQVRDRLRTRLQERGVEQMYEELIEQAPWMIGELQPSDTQRVLRALELLAVGQLKPRDSDNQLWTENTRHRTLLVGLTMKREQLYRQIDSRVERMVSEGAIEEVQRALTAGISDTASKALGFQELLDGDVEAMKLRTRQYAKRQLTWMRKLAGTVEIDVTDLEPDEVAARIYTMGLN